LCIDCPGQALQAQELDVLSYFRLRRVQPLLFDAVLLLRIFLIELQGCGARGKGELIMNKGDIHTAERFGDVPGERT
jgi:hypothetical protein